VRAGAAALPPEAPLEEPWRRQDVGHLDHVPEQLRCRGQPPQLRGCAGPGEHEHGLVVAHEHLVMVRTGSKWEEKNDEGHPKDVFQWIAIARSLAQQHPA